VLGRPKKRYLPSKRKMDYLRYFLVYGEPTHENAYRSALKAGFSESYARKISAHMSYWEAVYLLREMRSGGMFITKEFDEAILSLEQMVQEKASEMGENT